MQNQSRMQWVDVLRGMAVWFIVVGHFTQLAGDFYGFVFSFHVQLFFFLSGMFAARHAQQSVKQLLAELCNRLLIPFAGLSVLHTLFLCTLQNGGLFSWLAMLLDCAKGVRNGPYINNLWFFPCLAVMTLLYALLRRVIKQRELLLALCLLLSLAMRLLKEQAQWLWSVDSAVLYLFYYALGDYVRPFAERVNNGDADVKTKRLLWVGGAAASVFAAVWYTGYDALKAALGLQLPLLLDKTVQFFAAVILIGWAVFAAVLLRRSRLLAEIGKETMILSATEFMSRSVIDALLQLIGLPALYYTQLRALLMACVILAVGHKLWVPMCKTVFPGVFCREKDAPLLGSKR